MFRRLPWESFAIALSVLAVTSDASAATVQRSLGAPCIGAVPVTVTLNVTVAAGAADKNVLVTDSLPTGWKFVNSSLAPGGAGPDPVTGKYTVGWLLAPIEKDPDHDVTTVITYTALPPPSVSGAQSFAGNSQTADGSPGAPVSVAIAGSGSLDCVGAPVMATRTLPSSCKRGQANVVSDSVAVSKFVGDQVVTQLTVRESLPSGWNGAGAQPIPNTSQPSDALEWTVPESGVATGNASFSYKATPPNVAMGNYEFDGSITFSLSPSGRTGTVPIGGHTALDCAGVPPKIKGKIKLTLAKATQQGFLQFQLRSPAIGTGIGSGPAPPSAQLSLSYNGFSGLLNMPAGAGWLVKSPTTLEYHGAPATTLQVSHGKQIRVQSFSLGGLDLEAALSSPFGPLTVQFTLSNGSSQFLYCATFPVVNSKGKSALKFRNTTGSATLTSNYVVLGLCA